MFQTYSPITLRMVPVRHSQTDCSGLRLLEPSGAVCKGLPTEKKKQQKKATYLFFYFNPLLSEGGPLTSIY